ncbi:MAG TPA: hypothetical protein VL500_06310 [Candidatus Eisenbacteria bacterium]|jgi:hypothetical protein|nr:hypothetical protein [Candidatus Eisenbacteria bacterium]
MNKMMLAVAFALIAVLGGCATTTTARPMAVQPPPPPVDPALMAPQYAAVPGPVSPVPPPRPEAMMGPPQSWAWLHTPPYGCDSGPNALAIANDTDKHMRVVLDGEELQVRGAYGILPTLPPRTVAYVCLAHTGTHSLSGIAYSLRFGQLQEIEGIYGRFDYRGPLAGEPQPNGSVSFHINSVTLNLM